MIPEVSSWHLWRLGLGYHLITNKNKIGKVILISEKVDKIKRNITKVNKGHYLIIKKIVSKKGVNIKNL